MLRPVLILDFGSQYTQLIARRIREVGIFCIIEPYKISLKKIKELNPYCIIFSGGPDSVYDKNSPKIDKEIYNLNYPILGICYGMQLIAQDLGGKVEPSSKREYGSGKIKVNIENPLFLGTPPDQIVWQSHGDRVVKAPNGFETIASSENSPISAFSSIEKKIFGLQFHPEVSHTEFGKKILENFLRISKAEKNWSMKNYKDLKIKEIKELVGDDKVIGAVSGGVDSTVATVLTAEAIGKNFYGIFVDTGLLRKNEAKEVLEFLKFKNINLKKINAKEIFLKKLKGIKNPEKKRKIIGNLFIRVFEKEARKLKNVKYLLQGTIYPDVIESNPVFGPSSTIKTHHNVKGLPKKMELKLIEPLKFLFKDEVRTLGKELGIPEEILKRHPFPGPGLAVRIIGEITEKKIKILQEADYIFIEELKKAKLYDEISQAFAVLLPLKSVGVMGDKRTYEYVLALRAVKTQDFMTADVFFFPEDFLKNISSRIVNEVKGINRVVFDITTKPPSTIEWE